MKISVVFILFIVFISCNNSQPAHVFNGLEDSLQSESDSLQNQTGNTNAKNAIALKDSKYLLNVHKNISGVYLGTIDNKYFKLCVDNIYGDNAEGYIVTGDEKIFVKGKIFKLAVEPSPLGEVKIYRLLMSEKKKTALSGEYVITLCLSPKNTTGEGNWISHDKKQNSNIIIKERAL